MEVNANAKKVMAIMAVIMDMHYQTLINALDDLMIAMCKQKKLGLDPEINEALKKVTHARSRYKKALNLRILTQKKFNERATK